ncbi:MAG: hypothetical protein JWN04_2118, partial [Myxococcaceae bacterium]|nr:hypothetical protein [Myxococcaceae bacterium]
MNKRSPLELLVTLTVLVRGSI